MRTSILSLTLSIFGALAACGGSAATNPGGDGGQTGADASSSGDAASANDGGGDGAQAGDTSTLVDGGDAGSLIGRLIALTSHCNVISTAKYATDQGKTPTIDVCQLNGAFFWNADMDIDCDGQMTAECNINTDPAYQNQTSFNQSNNQPLIASLLPYVVIPLPSSRFAYTALNIKPGAVVIVIYNGKMSYGVFGDEGPSSIIGEASYAMAKSLGIDPNPSTGGVDSGVTYIVFTGTGAVATPIEDHQAAVTLGQTLAAMLLQNN